MCVFYIDGENQRTRKNHTRTQGEHAISTQKSPSQPGNQAKDLFDVWDECKPLSHCAKLAVSSHMWGLSESV